jgi:AcrR family transcriptional regulator
MYYHFARKQDVLAALLEETLLPLLALSEQLGERNEDPEARLWALCRSHIWFLASNPHNLGALYLLPELSSGWFREFHTRRDTLRTVYRDIIAATTAGRGLSSKDLTLRTHLIFAVVEGVIVIRRENQDLDPDAFSSRGADAALRLTGCPDDRLPRTRLVAAHLLNELGASAGLA